MTRSAAIYYVKVIPQGRRGVRLDLSNRVKKLTFEDDERKADVLKLTVDNWDLANFDNPVWAKGNFLEVSFGYPGNMSPARQLLIKKVTGATKLTVEAYDKAFLLDREARCRTFFDSKRSDVVKLIALKNGFGPDVQTIEDTEVVLPTITQAAETDAHLLRRLANKEGFEFFVDHDGFHWHSRNVEQRPLKKLTWYESGQGEIKSFNIENDITIRTGKSTTRGRDPIKKKDFEIIINHAQDLVQVLAPTAEVVSEAVVGLGNAARLTVETLAELSPISAKRRAKGKARKSRQLTIKMKLNIIGDPQLLAKSVVQIAGIGKRLSGNYYVKKVKHAISGDGYASELEVIRDGHNELKTSERLFEQRLGGGGGGTNRDCTAKVALVRKLLAKFSPIRRAEFIERAQANIPIAPSIGLELGKFEIFARNAIGVLKKNPENPPFLDAVRVNASSARASASIVNLAKTRDIADKIQFAALLATGACQEVIQAKVNDLKPSVEGQKQLEKLPAWFRDSNPNLTTVEVEDAESGKKRTIFVDKRGREQ